MHTGKKIGGKSVVSDVLFLIVSCTSMKKEVLLSTRYTSLYNNAGRERDNQNCGETARALLRHPVAKSRSSTRTGRCCFSPSVSRCPLCNDRPFQTSFYVHSRWDVVVVMCDVKTRYESQLSVSPLYLFP